MIDFCKPVRLRNGNPVRVLVVGQHLPYSVAGEARLDGGAWEHCTWTRDGYFALAIDDVVPDNPYDLVEVFE
jgi:hypothetical protein